MEKTNYRYTEDGVLLVRKRGAARRGIGGIIPPGREGWYRCSGSNPDLQYGKMVLFGWFGWHRFSEGDFLAGLLYLLTCGCFGVYYFYDLISMLTGNYSYLEEACPEGEGGLERRKSRVFYGPLVRRGQALLMLPVAGLILAGAVLLLYRPLGNACLRWIVDAVVSRITQENVSGFLWLAQ